MMRHLLRGLIAIFLPASVAAAGPVRVVPAPDTVTVPLPTHVGGRALHSADGWVRQWPGSYFETALTGSDADFRVGPGAAILKIIVDGQVLAPLVKPAPRLYRIEGLAPGRHVVRVEVATENQGWTTSFGGFAAGHGTRAAPLAARARQIEFVGDSHTVGYGNTSPTRECGNDKVWATTDASQGIGPLTARRYNADYQVNAISGRGIIRNYNGGAGDPLPVAYPFVLFDRAVPYRDARWRPQVVVIALGTNDFSTPLHAGEKWSSREALHADFEATYVRFFRSLRARNPRAFFILWATDMADGEIAGEVRRVAETLRASGERRIAFVPVSQLQLTACNYHPSLADDRHIAAAIERAIDAQQGVWRR